MTAAGAEVDVEALVERLGPKAARELAKRIRAAAREAEQAARNAAAQYPSRGRAVDEVLDEYRFMRDYLGLEAGEMPRHLGMSAAAFSRAMFRARGAGDERAADWTGLGYRPAPLYRQAAA